MEVNNETNCKVLRCKSSTDSNKLAGSIYSSYKEDVDSRIVIRVIGAGSLNQAVKAAIISNKYFAKKGVIVDLRPSFCNVEENMTAMDLRVIFSKI